MPAERVAPLSGYDASFDSKSRSTLIFPYNSRTEYHRWTRRRLLEKQRALEANFTFITRLKRKFGRRVVGKGITPIPVTRDAVWNGLAKSCFERWAANRFAFSIDHSRTFYEDQRFAAENVGAGDGEHFLYLTRRDGLPVVQPLDPYEVESPWGAGWSEYEDGVKFDEFLAPTEYAVRELPSPIRTSLNQWNWRKVPAGDLIHIFHRRRAKQFRGLPPIYSGLNDGNDAIDTLALEKATAKLHSLLAAATVRKPGNKGNGITNQIAQALGSDGKTNRLEEMMEAGALTVELEEGESLELKNSTRPAQPVIEGIKFYCALVALGHDLPFSVVYSFAGLGGTPTRADLEDAQDTFELGQDQIVGRQSQPLYVWKIADAMETGELPRCQDPFWFLCDWHGPAKMTVDYGRSAAANIDLMKAGMLSIPRYCEERGWNWETEMDKQIAWFKRAQERCEKEGIEFGRFFEATPGAQPKPAAAAADPSDD